MSLADKTSTWKKRRRLRNGERTKLEPQALFLRSRNCINDNNVAMLRCRCIVRGGCRYKPPDIPIYHPYIIHIICVQSLRLSVSSSFSSRPSLAVSPIYATLPRLAAHGSHVSSYPRPLSPTVTLYRSLIHSLSLGSLPPVRWA